MSHCCTLIWVSLIHPRHPDSQSVRPGVHLYAHKHPSCSGNYRSCSLTNKIIHIVKDKTYRVIKSICVCVFYFCSTSHHCGRHSHQLHYTSGSEAHTLCLHIWSHTPPLKHREKNVTILEKYTKTQETTSQIESCIIGPWRQILSDPGNSRS